MSLIDVFAGEAALRHIERNGLKPEDIGTVFGASGAAKWLAIYGLDKAIFTHWLPRSGHQVKLFGTSVGAFKLAAACHQDPSAGLSALAHAYIHQRYSNGLGADEIDREFDNLAAAVATSQHIGEILSHPTYRFSCGVVRCHGQLKSDKPLAQKLACGMAVLKNTLGRSGLSSVLDRVVFYDGRSEFPIASLDGYRTETAPLNTDNFLEALKASGSIPVYMHAVKDIPGVGEGVYRDGGLLDYHPVPSNFWDDDGLVLYPHFYPHCKEGWFDKFMPWRKASAKQLDNVIMISPSQKFLASIELGRIPDRRDFVTYANNHDERIRLWQEVADKSHQLGEEFLAWADSNDLAARVLPFPV